MKQEQLTAWALDELSSEEKSLVEAALNEDAAVQTQAAQTKEFCDFLTTHLLDPHIALDEDQRGTLIQAVSVTERLNDAKLNALPAPVRKSRWKGYFLKGLAAAAVLTVIASSTWMVMREQTTSALVLHDPVAENKPVDAETKEMEELPTIKSLRDNQVLKENLEAGEQNLLAGNAPRSGGQPRIDQANMPDGAALPPAQAAATDSFANSVGGNLGPRAIPMPMFDAAGDEARTDDSRSAGQFAMTPPSSLKDSLAGIGGRLGNTAPPAPAAPAAAEASGTAPARTTAVRTEVSAGRRADGALGDGSSDLVVTGSTVATSPGAGTKVIVGDKQAVLPGTSFETRREGITVLTGSNQQTSPRAVGVAAAPTAPGRGATVTVTPVYGDAIPPADFYPKEVPMPSKNRELERLKREQTSAESYTRIVENTLQDVTRTPLSTFSIDVDTAAYANVRRFLNQNTAPPPDAVRIEELINYFPMNEEGPPPGAKEPFAVKVEMADCPWQPQHRLARINIKGRDLGSERKASNLVFLVDVSGSMNEPNKLPLVQQSLRMLTDKLGEEDRVAMVVYAGSSGLVLPPTNGLNKAEIISAIDRLRAGGSTHGSAGLRLAYEQAVGGYIKGGVNRVILCTDGDFNVGISTPEELEKLIAERARSGVFLSVLGYGTGNLKDRTMETLADKGNGNYAYIDSLSEARKVLVEQMGGTLVTIAKDVKIQVEFNPRVIRSYRLIGYENRLLAKEDFNDDTKDAGEIGAGHSVTALYELVPANLPPGTEPPPVVDALKYQPAPAAAPAAAAAPTEPINDAQAKEALTVKLRYKEPEGRASQFIEVPVTDDSRRIDAASNEFKFTAAVAGFGLLLRQSSYAGNLTWDQVRHLAQEGKGSDPHGYRGEFLQLIEKARGVSGR